MKSLSVLASAAAMAVSIEAAGAGRAFAACDFDAVGKSTPIKANMVRMFAACPSTETPVVNTETEGGTPACHPVSAVSGPSGPSVYEFGDGSTCTVQAKARILPDCGTLTDGNGSPLGLDPGACHIVDIRAKCSGILNADNEPIDGPDDSGWALVLLTRASIADDSNGDMTVIDLPVTFEFDEPSKGSIQLASNTAVALSDIGGPALGSLPTCSQLAFRRVTLRDPDGAPFAVPGVASVPKGHVFE